MNKHFDTIFGTVGTLATLTLSAVNVWLAIIAGVLTILVMSFRAANEWLKLRTTWHRLHPAPEEKQKSKLAVDLDTPQ